MGQFLYRLDTCSDVCSMLEAMTNLTIFPKSLLILSIDFLTLFLRACHFPSIISVGLSVIQKCKQCPIQPHLSPWIHNSFFFCIGYYLGLGSLIFRFETSVLLRETSQLGLPPAPLNPSTQRGDRLQECSILSPELEQGGLRYLSRRLNSVRYMVSSGLFLQDEILFHL